jgi:hypothetical protein
MQGSYSKFTHAVAGLISIVSGFYAVSEGFREWVAALAALYAAHVPTILQPIPALAVGLYMWYHNGQSQQPVPADSKTSGPSSGLAVLLCCALVLGTLPTTGCTSPTDLDTVIADIPVATDIALSAVNIYEAIDGVQDAELETTIKSISGEVAGDLNLLKSLLQEYKASPNDGVLQRLDATFNAAQTHLDALLAAFHFTSPRTQAAASAVFNLVHALLLNVARLLPPDKTTVAPAATQVVARSAALGPSAPLYKPKDLANRFNWTMQDLQVKVQVKAAK